MFFLILGLLIFIGIHLVPAVPPVKHRLVDYLGPKLYKGVFALAALIGLVLIIIGYGHVAARTPVYDPPGFGRYLAVALMPFAFILLAAAYIPSGIKKITGHPLLWGVTVWALCHLLVRGDRASILLFGGFLAFALVSMISGWLRGIRHDVEPHPPWQNVIVVLAGLLLFAVVLWAHPYLFGVAVLNLSGASSPIPPAGSGG